MGSPWPYRQMGSQPRLPFPGQRGISSPLQDRRYVSSPYFADMKIPDLENASREEIKTHLASVLSYDRELLEDYVVENIRSEIIIRWMTKRQALEYDEMLRSSTNLIVGDQDTTSESKDETHLSQKLENGDFLRPLFSLARILSQKIHSSGFNVYGISGIGKTLTQYNPEFLQWDPPQSGQRSFLISKNTTVSGHVAETRLPVRVDDVHMDTRFPKCIGADDSSPISVMCLPVLLPNKDLVAVVEFYRKWHDAGYTENDLCSVQSILFWAATAIHKTAVCSSLHQQTEMNDFLLEVSRTYLDDITDIDNIIEHIMRFAKKLVTADRCSLFLYDHKTDELYSDLFDNGDEEDGKAIFVKRNEIRFHVSKGIAGHVASTKCVVNIPDAYADPRFNREVDKVTGYTTNNILCFPVMSENEVYGVVQMINKKTGGSFTKLDEDNFKMFAIFCALALRYSKIHARLESEHNSHEVVLEQFKHRMQAPVEETRELSRQISDERLPTLPVDFDRFQFSVMQYGSELPGFFVYMIKELCAPEYDLPSRELARFTLTVKVNYRNKPYHNWKHAMTVTHCMYCILKRYKGVFSKLESLALLVACLAHDVDHRGFSNQFLQKCEHPLAALYPSSTMEYHHYEMLLLIIGQKGHRIFSALDDESYQFVLDLMKHAILATDLALFFGNQRRVQDLADNNEFDINEESHRKSLIGIMITACDLSSTAKDWESTRTTVFDLYEEFWTEGDLRKGNGFSFIPMMDRDLASDVPDGQVGFYTNVPMRCYDTLVQVLPECEELLTVSNENLKRWRAEADKERERKEILEEERRASLQSSDGSKKSGELGVMLRGGMWMIEQSRREDQKAREEK